MQTKHKKECVRIKMLLQLELKEILSRFNQQRDNLFNSRVNGICHFSFYVSNQINSIIIIYLTFLKYVVHLIYDI